MNLAILDRLSRRELTGFALAGVVALAFAVDLAVVGPLNRRLARTRAECELLESGLGQSARTLARKEAVDAAYRKVSGFLAKRSADQSDERTMLAELEALAVAAGVIIVDSRMTAVQPGEYVGVLTVDVRIEAESDRLADFLRRVEVAPQLLRVKRMDLRPAERDPEHIVSGSLTITKLVTS